MVVALGTAYSTGHQNLVCELIDVTFYLFFFFFLNGEQQWIEILQGDDNVDLKLNYFQVFTIHHSE